MHGNENVSLAFALLLPKDVNVKFEKRRRHLIGRTVPGKTLNTAGLAASPIWRVIDHTVDMIIAKTSNTEILTVYQPGESHGSQRRRNP
ncbi:MAG: hypothetical protein GF398_10870 [Chitinivibrionales bacterium]|nr:hypothetical protein [Chitinivibrionales bacterium]